MKRPNSLTQILFWTGILCICTSCKKVHQSAPSVEDLLNECTYTDIRTYTQLPYYGIFTLNIHCKAAPDSYKRPVIFYIHGGGWNSGNKELRNAQIVFFARMGFVIVGIDYPQSQNPIDTLKTDRVLHPKHIQAIAKGFKWTYDHIEEYGGDRNNINIIGHSSGAHLAMLLATNERFIEAESLSLSNIHAVYCSDSGPYVTLSPVMSLSSSDSYLRLLYLCWVNAMGNDRAMWKDAVPLYHITPGKAIPPLLLGHTSLTYRVIPNTQIHQALIDNGYRAEHFTAYGVEHGKLFWNIGTSKDINGVGRKIVLFFRQAK